MIRWHSTEIQPKGNYTPTKYLSRNRSKKRKSNTKAT